MALGVWGTGLAGPRPQAVVVGGVGGGSVVVAVRESQHRQPVEAGGVGGRGGNCRNGLEVQGSNRWWNRDGRNGGVWKGGMEEGNGRKEGRKEWWWNGTVEGMEKGKRWSGRRVAPEMMVNRGVWRVRQLAAACIRWPSGGWRNQWKQEPPGSRWRVSAPGGHVAMAGGGGGMVAQWRNGGRKGWNGWKWKGMEWNGREWNSGRGGAGAGMKAVSGARAKGWCRWHGRCRRRGRQEWRVPGNGWTGGDGNWGTAGGGRVSITADNRRQLRPVAGGVVVQEQWRHGTEPGTGNGGAGSGGRAPGSGGGGPVNGGGPRCHGTQPVVAAAVAPGGGGWNGVEWWTWRVSWHFSRWVGTGGTAGPGTVETGVGELQFLAR